jgi:hypothetical protein
MFRSVTLVIAVTCAAAGLASAQTIEEQNACKDDAFRICSHTIPDRERTFQCMIAQKDTLSPACRTAMAAQLPPDPEPPKGRRAKSIARSSASDQVAQGAQRSKKGPVDLAPPGR